ncbi:MAG: hypothetical protein HY719_11470 [Planctomycetes bacterium]|nr:hypothetical protein [Planctomycetota bacterium]
MADDSTDSSSRIEIDGITFVPSIHGRSLFAVETRRLFLEENFDCVAVELPDSLGPAVVEAAALLPSIHVVLAQELEGDHVYVPIDPCDSIIEAVRLAAPERRRMEFIDLEVTDFRTEDLVLPDEQAARTLGLARYYRAVEPALPGFPAESQGDLRDRFMAARLRALRARHRRILCVVGMNHLRGIRRHYAARTPVDDLEPAPAPFQVRTFAPHPDSLYYILGELPYVAYQYERHRASIALDEFAKTDTLKSLLLAARDEYHEAWPEEEDRIPTKTLQLMLHYVRNLCLLSRRLSPSLWELAVAARGVAGNDYAVKVLETAKYYPFLNPDAQHPTLRMTDRAVRLEDGAAPVKKRLSGLAKEWKRLRLERKPGKRLREQYRRAWNPLTSCSWPPEDVEIENFAGRVRERALHMAGLLNTRTEEFVASMKDGLAIRETMRHRHLGNKVFVKEEPPVRGKVGAVVMIFEDDREDGRFPWRLTWWAEHENESTLAFYATDFRNDPIGPGICRALYGGCLFLFPPRHVPEVWRDRRFAEARTGMERLVLAGLFHGGEKYTAYVARRPPTERMRRFAREAAGHLVYVPLSAFSPQKVRRMRRFHVLNGERVRAWAARYIR